MDAVLSGVKQEIQISSERREKINTILKDLFDSIRVIQASSLRMHLLYAKLVSESDAKCQSDVSELRSIMLGEIAGLKRFWDSIYGVLQSPEQVEKYRYQWRSAVQQICGISAFLYWIQHFSLIPKQEFEQQLGLANTLGVDVEDYLIGICSLPQELSRLCLNCVTNGNLVIPFKVRDFVSELFSSFQQLNLRNDLLRKRYDSIKYELQKVESVIYDIKIRNLAPAQ